MADEQLRLQAVVVDQFSGPLKKLNDALSSVAGNQSAKAVAKDWKGVGDQINSVGLSLRTNLIPLLSSVGVVSAGAGGAFGAIAMGVRTLSSETQSLRLFAREVGMTVDQVRAFSTIGEKFGASSSTMQQGLKRFADEMFDVQRRRSEVAKKMANMGMGEDVEKLVGAPNLKAAIERFFEMMANVPDPVRRRRIIQMWGLPEDWSPLVAEIGRDLGASMAKAQASIGTIGPEAQRSAKQFEDNMELMRHAAERFRVQALGPLIPEVNKLFDAFNKGGVGGALKQIDQATDLGFGGTKRTGTLPELETQLGMAERGETRALQRGDTSGALLLRKEIRELSDAIKRLKEGGGATVQQQSFGGDGGGGFGGGGLIHRAGFGVPGFRGVGLSGGGLSGVGGGGAPSGGGINPGGGFGAGGLKPAPIAPGTGIGHSSSRAERADFIRREALARGIDPDVAMRVAQSEGFNSYVGDRGKSFGDWQLYTGGGLGNEFQKRTGLNPADPSTWREQTKFALDHASKHGWGPWHGAKRVGIGRTQGIGGQPGALGPSPEGITDISGAATSYGGVQRNVQGFIVHHSGGRGGAQGVLGTLNQRGLSAQFAMERDGRIFRTSPEGRVAFHMRPSEINGLNNANTLGMEVIARDDRDIAPAQRAAFRRFWAGMTKQHPGIQIFGHGEVNPSSKQATEGATITRDIRQGGPEIDLASRRVPSMWERTLGGYMGRPDPSGFTRSADSMMGRAFGPGGVGGGSWSPKLDANGTVNISLTGGLEKAPARVSMDGMFRDVKISRGSQVGTGDASP